MLATLASLQLLQLMPEAADAAGPPPRVQIPAGDEVPAEAREYFSAAVARIQDQLGDGFTARLAVYGVTKVLPSGVPGDPAKDFSRGGDAHCGAFSPFPGAPYAICPAPGAPPGDPAAAACCRHLAFCVPYSRLGLAVEDRVSTVVVSPRLWAFAPEQWRGVLAHELGHAADFYLFGARYRLTTHAQPTLAAALQAIDAEADPELRADALGEVLVLAPAGVKLCYDPVFKIQATVPPAARCDGDGEGEGLMRHYTHAPLQGSVSKVRRR